MNNEISIKLNKHIEKANHLRISKKTVFVDDERGEDLDILNLFLDLKENKTYYKENKPYLEGRRWQVVETTTSIKMKIIEKIASLIGGKE